MAARSCDPLVLKRRHRAPFVCFELLFFFFLSGTIETARLALKLVVRFSFAASWILGLNNKNTRNLNVRSRFDKMMKKEIVQHVSRVQFSREKNFPMFSHAFEFLQFSREKHLHFVLCYVMNRLWKGRTRGCSKVEASCFEVRLNKLLYDFFFFAFLSFIHCAWNHYFY